MRPKILPSFEVLDEYFHYNPETGVLITKKKLAQRVPADTVVGSLSREGYLKITLKGESYPAHRVAWKLFHKTDPDIIDHINWDKTDNRIINLRSVTYSQNNSSRKNAKGYSKLPNGTLRVVFLGKDVGYFYSEEEASACYKKLREEFLSL